MGAWIETKNYSEARNQNHVAPCMGAWIETEEKANYTDSDMSHPVWVRGLKLPLLAFYKAYFGRTLYGCVD